MHDDFSTFLTQIFLDANVVLEGLPLDQLPWREIDPTGPILLLAAPTMLKQVDSKKRDGRLAVRARDFNRLLAPLATDGCPVLVSEGPPRVCLTAARCRRIDWQQYDDLAPDDEDACIVAEVLHAHGISDTPPRVVSQDTHFLITAQRHGLRAFRIPDAWLRPPEQHPKDAENARLKQQLAELKKTEPQFATRIEVASEGAVIYRVPPLAADESAALIAAIVKAHPKPVQDTGALVSLKYDSGLDKRYEEYKAQAVPRFAKKFHEGLEVQYGQVPITVVVENNGNIRADNVIIDVHVAGGWINEKSIAFNPRGPSSPRVESPYEKLYVPPSLPVYSPRVGKHEFALDIADRSRNFAAQCEDFRHGQRWSFNGVLWIDPNDPQDTVVVVKVTAANQHGEHSSVCTVEKEVRRAQAFDLVDLRSLKLSVAPAIQPLIQAALDDRQFGRIEFYKA